MGDPFWRRVRDRDGAEKARTLGAEYTSLNTRDKGTASLFPPSPRASDTQPRRSRNDLFDADWGWKGAQEEQRVRAAAGVGALVETRSAPDVVPRTPPSPPLNDEPRLIQRHDHVVVDSQLREEPGLGAPIQLKPLLSTLPTPGALTPSHHQRSTNTGSPASRSLAGPAARTPRSRNDTIYNVDHLTIIPPPPSRSVKPSTRETEGIECRLLETSSSATTGYPRITPHAVIVASPVSPVTPTTPVPITPVTPERDSTPSIGDERRASGGGGGGFEGGDKFPSPAPPALTGTPNSSTRTTPLRKTPTTALPEFTTPATPTPLSGLSALSRSSSLTAVQSPSSALSNVVSRAGRLLLPDAHEDDLDGDAEGGRTSPAVDAQRDTSVEEAVARVRVDIVSRQWLVGYGRYAKVYLGSYKPLPPAFPLLSPAPKPTPTTAPPPTIAAAGQQKTSGWTLCAVKVFDGDADSLRMARKEDEMLEYLQREASTSLHDESDREGSTEAGKDKGDDGRRFIVPRIALVDDTRIEPPPPATSDLSRAGSLRGAGSGRTTPDGDHTFARQRFEGSTTTTAAAVRRMEKSGRHGRSASETTTAVLRRLGAQSALAGHPVGFLAGEHPPSPRRPILLLPFFANGSMATFLKTREAGMVVEESLWMVWFAQGLRALSWCKRKGVLHNDIKPANFLVDDALNLKLGDFGSALLIAPDSPPHDGIGLGTVPYSSPEIVDPASDRTFSFPSDLFSFGVTMRQCMTGREPYEGLRAVEMMYHVRKGNYWEWHSRRRLAGVTDDVPCASPATSSNQQCPISPATTIREQLKSGVRRTESLREPARPPPPMGETPSRARRPGLARTPSSDTAVRQAATISNDPARPDTRASVMMGAGEDKREEWLRVMVDPDPARRPTVEELLDEVAQWGRQMEDCN